MARMSIADRKRAKKARYQERRESAHKAAMEYQVLVEALRGYKHFHELSEGTSTVQQAGNTSAGFIGLVKYWNMQKQ